MNIKFFKLAEKESLKSNHLKYKMGACIVLKNKLISAGHNSIKTHPDSNSFHKRMHAEFSAILSARRMGYNDLSSKVTMYLWRVTKDGTKATSMPCVACQKLIREYGIEKVYYTENGGYSCFTL